MKHLPNIITSIRLIAATVLLFNAFNSGDHGRHCFLPLFIIAGISDMLDGIVARKFNLCTEFGAKLDSVSDLFLYAGVTVFLLLNAFQSLRSVFALLLAGLALQLAHIGFSLAKHGCFPAYHTNFSRLIAYFIFFGINFFWITHSTIVLPSLVIAWMLCSLEGVAITTILRSPLSNLNSVSAAIAANRQLAPNSPDSHRTAEASP